MPKGKKEFKEAIRTTLILEQELLEHVKKKAIEMSFETGRLVTPSEAIRRAIEKIYPMTKTKEGKKTKKA